MTTYQRCKNEHAVSDGIYEIDSDTSSKTYKVDMSQTPPTCTCVAYAIGRNRAKSNKPVKDHGPQQAWCKHISRVYDIHCSFDSRIHGESMLPVCPLCGGDLETVEVPEPTVVPTSKSSAGEAESDSETATTTVDTNLPESSLLAQLEAKIKAADEVVNDLADDEETGAALEAALNDLDKCQDGTVVRALDEQAKAEHAGRVPVVPGDDEANRAIARGDYTVIANNYLTVRFDDGDKYELHRDEGEWHWSEASAALDAKTATTGVDHDTVLLERGLLKIETPDGVVLITHLDGVGTQIACYTDGGDNPFALLHMDKK